MRAGGRTAALVAMTVVAGCAGESRPAPPDPATLVRQGAHPLLIRSGDLDGDGIPEVALASASDAPNEFGLPTPYLEVFAYRGGAWRRLFDATGNAPPGAGAPGQVLVPAEQGFAVGQSVHVLELVDFRGDGTPEIVAGVANAGATVGPVELWVIAMRPDGSLVTEFYEGSDRGGEIEVLEGRLRFEFPVYRRRDPGCCPSRLARETIGWNAATGRIEVLERRVERR